MIMLQTCPSTPKYINSYCFPHIYFTYICRPISAFYTYFIDVYIATREHHHLQFLLNSQVILYWHYPKWHWMLQYSDRKAHFKNTLLARLAIISPLFIHKRFCLIMCHNKMPHTIASDGILSQMILADCPFLDKKCSKE